MMTRFWVRFYKKGCYATHSFDTLKEARHFASIVDSQDVKIYDYYYNEIE